MGVYAGEGNLGLFMDIMESKKTHLPANDLHQLSSYDELLSTHRLHFADGLKVSLSYITEILNMDIILL